MPAGYNSQPISGFSGHMPGAKWQVGRRYVPPDVKKEDLVPISNADSSAPQPFIENGIVYYPQGYLPPGRQPQNEVHFSIPQVQEISRTRVDEGTQSEMSFRQDLADQGVNYINGVGNDLNTAARSQASFLSPTSSNYSVGFDAQGRPMRVPQNYQQQQHPGGYGQGQQQQYQPQGTQGYQNAGGNYDGQPSRISYPNYENDGRNTQQQQQYGYSGQGNAQITEFPSQTGHRSRAEMTATSASGRSKSLPRKRIEKDPFEGVESGWWSKGEVLRNRERREMAEKGKSVTGGDWNAPKVDSSPPRRTWKEREDEMNDIPAAGYSGHIPQMRQIGVGKPFHRAAKEAKEQYVERRRAMSGGREQFYSNGSNVHFDGGGSEQLNYAHSVAPGMHTRSAF